MSRKDEYTAELAKYEAAIAEFKSKADKLELAERALVAESHEDEACRQMWVEKYDAALAARDEAGIQAYMKAVDALHDRYIKRKAALDAVRKAYDALERKLPRRPRRTWHERRGRILALAVGATAVAAIIVWWSTSKPS